MHRYLALVLLVAGCKKSREDMCDELAKVGIAFADQLGKQLGSGDAKSLGADPEIKAKMAEFRAECLTWPDEVFACMRAGDETSPTCKEAMTKVTGLVSTDVMKAPAGPPIVASAKLGEASWDGLPVALAADGTLTAAPKDALVAVDATGHERWRVDIKHDGWLLVDEAGVLVGDRAQRELVALDPATGKAAWRVAIPVGADEYDSRTTEGAVRVGGKLYVAISDGRVLRVDPAACAKPKPKGCLEQAFALDDETFDNPALHAIGNDLLVAESDAIRRITTTGAVVASVRVRDSLGGVAVGPGERVAAVMDDELVLFDFAHCAGPSPVVLSRKRGRMYIRGEGECDDCVRPPTQCLVARAQLADVDSMSPTVLRDGSVMVSNFDGPARAAIDGNKHWATQVDSVGPMREVGDTVVFVSRGDDKQPARAVALDTATGKAKWMRPLDGIESSSISSTTDPIVETAGPWLVVGAKGAVSWIKLR